ncbi:aminotransferase class I/II-fold pyridoxal phosphate-dependent enzyme [Parahaliea maris]|uniref:Aminotransferase class I/II-fold pyridoxal phosphate-dependent enzyme n=1 Tax=Parahaliea maris TaxID=2716870 RepID=A0A5C9A2A1_9GAMM|nr:aminotransferase class I/II-fold pyridoxal phosphate-dependent enzyme [Parahaliea maris]TXS94199.1 aminotransferase class I/II-fold pyridoxal phosphate-dependent enzyme [Parahaliea maris]
MTSNKLAPRVVRYGGAMYGQDEIQQVNAVLEDPNGLIPGTRVCEFEARVAEFMGKKHGVMVNSGSSALMIAMRLLNLPAGSEIITPALTFSTDVATIYQAGYTPVFVDVGLDSYQILADRVEDVITENTRALLVPDLVGGIGDWDRLREIADRHGLKLVHDSCDTLGGSLRGRKTATRADISVTSFSIFHIITALGNGGMVFFDDDALLDRALMLRAWGRSSEKYMFGTKVAESDGRFLEQMDGVDYDSLFIFEDLAYGFIPNEAGAAFGLGQMNRIDELWQLRNARFQDYYAFFERHADKFIVPTTLPETETTWICFPLQIRPETGWSRKALQIHLEDSGVFSRVIFSGNITRHPMLKGRDYRIHPAGLGNCDQIMQHGVMLPCHPTMSGEDQRYVQQVLEAFIEADGKP